MPAFADPESRIRRVLRKNGDLERITVSFSHHGVLVQAVPTSFHPLVGKRRELAFAEAGGTVTIQEATQINSNSLARPVANGFATTVGEALDKLDAELKKLAIEPENK